MAESLLHHCRSITNSEPHSRPSKTATSDEMVDKVHDIVLGDRRLKAREIAETTSISEAHLGHILHEIFGVNKLSAQTVPRFLIPE